MKGLVKLLRVEWERSLGVVLIVAGVVTLIAGYSGVHKSQYLSVQMSYLTSGGIGGLFLLGLGAVLIVAAGLHDEWRKLDEIAGLLQGDAALAVAREIVVDDVQSGRTSSGEGVGSVTAARGAGRRPETATLAVARDGLAVRSGQQMVVVTAIGALGLASGWAKARSAVRVDDALRAPMLAALVVIVALALAGTRLVQLQGLVAGRKGSVYRRFASAGQPETTTAPLTAAEPISGGDGRLYRGPSQKEVHRRSCPTLANVSPLREVTGPVAGDTACRLCRPLDET
jgi:hypothetical protein